MALNHLLQYNFNDFRVFNFLDSLLGHIPVVYLNCFQDFFFSLFSFCVVIINTYSNFTPPPQDNIRSCCTGLSVYIFFKRLIKYCQQIPKNSKFY